MIERFLTTMAIVLALLLVWLFTASGASSHEWYDKDCCSGDDCRPVKPGEVEAYDDGVCVGYRHVQTGKKWCRGSTNLRVSKDGGDHICWPPSFREPNCYYEGWPG